MTTNPPPADADLMGLDGLDARHLPQARAIADQLCAERQDFDLKDADDAEAWMYARNGAWLALSRTPSPVADEALVEAMAKAMKPKLFEGGPDETRGPVTVYERNVCRQMARAALQQVQPLIGGWRTIESAPKDGRRVMLWSEQWTAPACGIWANVWTVGYDLPPYLHEPTHWQPLPAPPVGVETVG